MSRKPNRQKEHIRRDFQYWIYGSFLVQQKTNIYGSAEVEYMAASLAAFEAIWMTKILVGLFGSHLDPMVIHCDNQSYIKLSVNPMFHDRYKHIDIRYHHIIDCVQ